MLKQARQEEIKFLNARNNEMTEKLKPLLKEGILHLIPEKVKELEREL